jgi:hypothetical protein
MEYINVVIKNTPIEHERKLETLGDDNELIQAYVKKGASDHVSTNVGVYSDKEL